MTLFWIDNKKEFRVINKGMGENGPQTLKKERLDKSH